jgi:hypothetical protein
MSPAPRERATSSRREAVVRGLFGALTIFVDDEMFCSQDRLDFVEAALKRAMTVERYDGNACPSLRGATRRSNPFPNLRGWIASLRSQ